MTERIFFLSWVGILFGAQVNLDSHSTFQLQSKFSFYTHSSVGSPSKLYFIMSLVKSNSQHIFPLTSYTLYKAGKGVSVSMLIQICVLWVFICWLPTSRAEQTNDVAKRMGDMNGSNREDGFTTRIFKETELGKRTETKVRKREILFMKM